MKNIHVLPTDKPSRLRYNLSNQLVLTKESYRVNYGEEANQHLYITSDEKIKVGDYIIELDDNEVFCSKGVMSKNDWCKKVILTTDTDLIKDGVQAIDDEFLEWFVNHPTCEEVKVEKFEDGDCEIGSREYINYSYEILIPKEEPLQETLEEAVKGNTLDLGLLEIELNHTKTLLASCEKALKDRDKQSERMYSEEEVEIIIQKLMNDVHCGDLCYGDNVIDFKKSPRQWFEQFKKK
jgi:hypothetical protein